MGWRLARSLVVLRDQINQKWPDRVKSDDGTIGDQSHAQRKSEHNPDENGVVRALDITHDPSHGVDSEAIANALRLAKDPRVLYIISNKKIASEKDGWRWRPYDGTNPHNHHFHISVSPNEALYDSNASWDLSQVGSTQASGFAAPPMPVLRFGMQGLAVKVLQRMLGLQELGYYNITVETAVKRYQTAKGLVSDGVVGSYTWEKLMERSNV